MQNSSCYKKTKHAIFSEKRTFLNPRTCVDQGVSKKCSFFEKFGVLCFLVTPVLKFALLPYYQRIQRNSLEIQVREFLKNCLFLYLLET